MRARLFYKIQHNKEKQLPTSSLPKIPVMKITRVMKGSNTVGIYNTAPTYE